MRAWKKVGLGALAAAVIGGGAQVGAMAASRSDDTAAVRPRTAAVDIRREDRRENRREDRREAEPGDDHGREIEPGDRGRDEGMEQGEDRSGPSDNSGPGSTDDGGHSGHGGSGSGHGADDGGNSGHGTDG